MLTLLYDKTFPPRSQQQGNVIKQLQGFQMTEPRDSVKPATSTGGRPPLKTATETLHRFNYYGHMNTHSGIGDRIDMGTEDDLEMLEREIEEVMNREHVRAQDMGGPSLERRIE